MQLWVGLIKISSFKIHDLAALHGVIFIVHVFVRLSANRKWQNAIQLNKTLFLTRLLVKVEI